MTAALLVGHRDTGRRKDSAGRTILLHLAPGAAAMAVYAAAAPIARHVGVPTIAALAVSGLLGVAPVQLAVLAGARRAGEPVILLRARLPVRQVVCCVLAELLLAALAFALTAPLGAWLEATAFAWWPAGWALDPGTGGGSGRGPLLITAALVMLGSVVVAPLVEEFYFRGYLLPRMPARLGPFTSLTHAALFAGYHVWTPWLVPTRILAVLPLAYIARRTGDLRIGMVTHAVLNSVDVVVLLHVVVLGS